MHDIVNSASIQELKILLILSGLLISILIAIVGFFIVKGITKSAKSLEKMAFDIGEIKLTVMHVDTKHNELEKRVDYIQRQIERHKGL